MGLIANGSVTPVGQNVAFVAGIVLPIVSTVVVLMRFGMRRWQGSRWTGTRYGPDDWLVLAGLPFLVGMGACLSVGATKGLGQYYQSSSNTTLSSHYHHSYSNATADPSRYETPEERAAYQTLKKALWVFWLLMYPASACAKLSIIFFYRRVFHPDYFTNLWRACLAMASLVTLSTIIFFFLSIFNCGADVAYNWAPLLPYTQHCWSVVRLEQPYANADLVLNVLLLLLPLPTLHRLHLALRHRFAIGSVVLLGSCVIGVSVVRVVLFYYYAQTSAQLHAQLALAAAAVGDDDLRPLTDTVLRTNTTMMYWSLIEVGLALMSACLPTLCVHLPSKVLAASGHAGAGADLATRVAGRRAAARSDGNLTPAPGSGYGRSSGWFVRPRGLNGANHNAPSMTSIDQERLTAQRSEVDVESFISELNLDDASISEPERGRTRERVAH